MLAPDRAALFQCLSVFASSPAKKTKSARSNERGSTTWTTVTSSPTASIFPNELSSSSSTKSAAAKADSPSASFNSLPRRLPAPTIAIR